MKFQLARIIVIITSPNCCNIEIISSPNLFISQPTMNNNETNSDFWKEKESLDLSTFNRFTYVTLTKHYSRNKRHPSGKTPSQWALKYFRRRKRIPRRGKRTGRARKGRWPVPVVSGDGRGSCGGWRKE